VSGDTISKILQGAQALAQQGHVDQAIAECEQGLSGHPNEPALYLCLGELSLKRQFVPQSLDAYAQAAKLFLKKGNVVDAVSCYRQILKLEPDRSDVCVLLGDVNAGRGYMHNAVADYLGGAKVYLRKEALAETIEIYEKVLALNPYNLSVRLRLAEMQLQQGRTAEGVAEYFRLGEGYERRHRDADANAVYRLILTHSPGHPEASRRLGLPASEAEAVQRDDFPVNGDANPSDFQSPEGFDREDTQTALVDSPKPDETQSDAVTDVDIILLDDDKDVEPLRLQEDSSGDAHTVRQPAHQVHDPEDAGGLPAEFEEYLEIQYELALAYKEMGLLDEAIETFEQALRSPSRFLDSCTMMALCDKDRQVNSAAIKWLERASGHPQCEGAFSVAVRLALAQLYELVGNVQKTAGQRPDEHLTTQETPLENADSEKNALSPKYKIPEKPHRISLF
jgi:tetratricopeptide (TPR) repeat protein